MRGVRFRWPGQNVDLLDIEELVVNQGEHLFIKGPSGSGKTTLLNLLTGITTANSGTVSVLGTHLGDLSARRRDQFRSDHLGIIFQQFNLLPYLSVLDNVTLPCGFSSRRKQRANPVEKSAQHLLHQLNIDQDTLGQSVASLSVGQQQRTAVARALLGRPEVVIADEPTSALDHDNRDRFVELLFDEADRQGSTLLFVSHDSTIAERFDRVIDLPSLNRGGRS